MPRSFHQLDRILHPIQSYRHLRRRDYAIPDSLREADAHQVLTAFMNDDAYNSFFLGDETVGVYDTPSVPPLSLVDAPRHGPFMLERLSISNYKPVSLSDVSQRMEVLVGPPTGDFPYNTSAFLKQPYYSDALEDIRALLSGLDPESTEAFVLDVDPFDEWYMNPEFAPHSEFVEYVVLDRARSLLHLLVVMHD